MPFSQAAQGGARTPHHWSVLRLLAIQVRKEKHPPGVTVNVLDLQKSKNHVCLTGLHKAWHNHVVIYAYIFRAKWRQSSPTLLLFSVQRLIRGVYNLSSQNHSHLKAEHNSSSPKGRDLPNRSIKRDCQCTYGMKCRFLFHASPALSPTNLGSVHVLERWGPGGQCGRVKPALKF